MNYFSFPLSGFASCILGLLYYERVFIILPSNIRAFLLLLFLFVLTSFSPDIRIATRDLL